MKKIKKIFTLALGFLLVVGPGKVSHAAGDIRVNVSGNFLPLKTAPIIEEGRTLVPLRSIFEALGVEVHWKEATRTIIGKSKDRDIILKVDSRLAQVNGQGIQMDVPARIVGGQTLVPVRFIAESLDAPVEWDGQARVVYINRQPKDQKEIKNDQLFSNQDLLPGLNQFKSSQIASTYGRPLRLDNNFDDIYYGMGSRGYYDFGSITYYKYHPRLKNDLPHSITIDKRLDLGTGFLRGIRVGDSLESILDKFPVKGADIPKLKSDIMGTEYIYDITRTDNPYGEIAFLNELGLVNNPSNKPMLYQMKLDGGGPGAPKYVYFQVSDKSSFHSLYHVAMKLEDNKITEITLNFVQ